MKAYLKKHFDLKAFIAVRAGNAVVSFDSFKPQYCPAFWTLSENMRFSEFPSVFSDSEILFDFCCKRKPFCVFLSAFFNIF